MVYTIEIIPHRKGNTSEGHPQTITNPTPIYEVYCGQGLKDDKVLVAFQSCLHNVTHLSPMWQTGQCVKWNWCEATKENREEHKVTSGKFNGGPPYHNDIDYKEEYGRNWLTSGYFIMYCANMWANISGLSGMSWQRHDRRMYCLYGTVLKWQSWEVTLLVSKTRKANQHAANWINQLWQHKRMWSVVW